MKYMHVNSNSEFPSLLHPTHTLTCLRMRALASWIDARRPAHGAGPAGGTGDMLPVAVTEPRRWGLTADTRRPVLVGVPGLLWEGREVPLGMLRCEGTPPEGVGDMREPVVRALVYWRACSKYSSTDGSEARALARGESKPELFRDDKGTAFWA